eukprot:CAMPEP_0175872886 /NCGR_PEP_ID=MMETSP0107_2-20121207/37988_1 /TAXON_ID=195067 ORGANISM="Goniomonas pacifica, Strain CCMP1869" /NCGR_SAMPLE_ID=MMETSP0107_2 /ASSEMBLY_ACC=CAM_ASM_000203 /LENGTH=47 /DNA_ID= /DNA_START= /DNA_END= /DNA_ORIENTATION=
MTFVSSDPVSSSSPVGENEQALTHPSWPSNTEDKESLLINSSLLRAV